MKIELDSVVGGYSLTKINENFQHIQDEFNNKVLYRDNVDGEANTLEDDVDINGKRLYNLGAPQYATDAARLGDIPTIPVPVGTGAALNITYTPTSWITSINVQSAIEQLANGVIKVVNSITALKAILKTTGGKVFVSGYYSSGDGGGGGEYYYDAADTTSVDNGGTIIVASDGGRWKLITNRAINVDQFGAKGDGSTDDYNAINAAQIALASLGGGSLWFTSGKTYLITTALTMLPSITYTGPGRTSVDNAPTGRCARIVSSTTNIFNNSTTLIAGVGFKNLWIESLAGGGHVFDWSSSGIVAKVEIAGCTLIQGNANKSIINGTASGGVFSIWMHDFEYRYLVANSVPAIKLASPTVNSITMERFWSICTLGATSGTYSIWIESTNAGGAAYNCHVRQGVFEVPGGGAVNMLSCRQSSMEELGVYDLAVAPINSMFKIAKGAGPVSQGCNVSRLYSVMGTNTAPDLTIDLSSGGAGLHSVENCKFTYYDQVSANANGVEHHGNDIANYLNCAFTEMGSQGTLDLRWVNQSAGAHTYTIWNGFTGTNNGYLSWDQDGAYIGAISPSRLFQWGGTKSNPAFYVGQSGLLNTKNKIYPGTPAGIDQASCGFYAMAGVPSNTDGLDGDWTFSSNGHLYFKTAGAWVVKV
jgi:hypothetical protein